MKTVRWFALLITATVPVSTALSPAAAATPSENADAVIVSQATVDGVDYITREITIQTRRQHRLALSRRPGVRRGPGRNAHPHDEGQFGRGLPRGLGGHRGQRGGSHPHRPQPGPGASGAVG